MRNKSVPKFYTVFYVKIHESACKRSQPACQLVLSKSAIYLLNTSSKVRLTLNRGVKSSRVVTRRTSRVHSLLDRYAALELLEWSQTAKIPEPLSYDVQNDLLSPLNALSAEFSIFGDGKKHYIKTQNKEIELLAYPAMWSETSSLLPKNAISISDRKLKYALPYVDEIMKNE